MSLNFNQESDRPRFISKANPIVPHSWQIFERKAGKADYEPVGNYTLIDIDEPIDITEKKLVNLTGIMNGRKTLVDFTNLTQERVLFTIVEGEDAGGGQQRIVLRTHKGSGVSKENAVLTIDKGVFDDFQDNE